ncbi:MAG: ferritin [Alphaproteobacteria bacterium]|nr:ferritin [Alphaproteobacteria bacterium]MBV9151463.1 ferritin [Alphaproteobacteria bacterium]MBV9585199.1 ferritin [Alphaproteobacteria bacterium]MBV9967311.1 ferritin [Alphaproteobacteria bacterium]
MSSEVLHAPREVLSLEARMLHNAITSLMEELEAVDWYRQRADDTEDDALREILLHNMREEMEHASMVLEWIRRHNSDFAGHLRTYLFTETPITGIEKAVEAGSNGAAAARPARRNGATVTIGSLKGAR